MKANAEKGTDADVIDAIASARDVKSFMVVRWVVKTVCWMSFLKLQVYYCELCYTSSMFHFLNSLLEDELSCSTNMPWHSSVCMATVEFVRYSIIFQWTREHK